MNQPLGACTFDACTIGSAIDGMCVGMIVANAAGRLIWSNRSAKRLLGVDREECEGRRLAKILRDPAMVDFWHQVQAGDDVMLGEVQVHWPESRDLKVNASASLDQAGQRQGWVLLFCDVSQERSVRIQLSREATERLLSLTSGLNGASATEPHEGLTAQELRILRLVGGGLGNEEIAREIHVASSTVRTHLKHVYAKLGLASRAEAIRYAMQHALVRD